jgi:hypothetical protein
MRYSVQKGLHRSRKKRLSRTTGTDDRGSFAVLLRPERVTPELVLIDPDLHERERARLNEVALLNAVLADSAPDGAGRRPPLVSDDRRRRWRPFRRNADVGG